jgi:hypothetical protein
MLAGHYGVAYALGARSTGVRLVWLVIAVQAVDIAFFVLAPLGVEQLIPIASANGPLGMQLVSIPYSHSLTLTLVYAAIIAAVGAMLRQWRVGAAIAIALASHWLLDLFVHLHDLPLTVAEESKVGWGLWQRPAVALALEIGVLAGGIGMLWRTRRGHRERVWLGWTFFVLAVVQVLYVITPAQPTVIRMAIGAQVIYLITALLAWRIDRLAAVPARPSSRPASG